MLPSSALIPEFFPRVRERGDAYADAGAVDLIMGSPTDVRALVQGSHTYAVRITRTPDHDETRFRVSCACPYFVDEAQPCKHIWATLCIAERAGHLLGHNGAALDRDSAYLELIEPADRSPEFRKAALRSPSSGSLRAARPEAIPPSRASLFLASVQQHLRVHERRTANVFPYADAVLLYTIDGPASVAHRTTVFTVMYQRRAKHGELSKPKVAKLSGDDIALAPAGDRRILALLAGSARPEPSGSWPSLYSASTRRPATYFLPSPLALELLPTIARTARMWLRAGPPSTPIAPLAWDDGPAWRFRLTIDPSERGFLVNGAFERNGLVIPVTEPSFILADGLIAMRGSLARFEGSADAAFLPDLRTGGPVEVPRSETTTLAQVIVTGGIRPASIPDELRVTDVRVIPTPRVSLERPSDLDLTARLSFDYDGSIVEQDPATPTAFDAVRRRLVHRDLAAETALARRLPALGFRVAGGGTTQGLQLATKLLPGVARALVREGWHVTAEGLRYRAASSVQLSVTSGIDWFDLTARADFGDASAALPGLLAALRTGATTVRLGDGSIGILPEDWLKRYGALVSAGRAEGNHLRFTRTQAALLDALIADREADTAVEVDATFMRARDELARFSQVAPVPPPASFVGSLRPYQQEGLGWFAFLRRFGFGGCLADDMGLGKTVMVLALLEARRTAGQFPPSLVVVPRSLVGNWVAEARQFTPELRVLDHSHAQRSTDTSALRGHDLVLVTYGTLRRDIHALSQIEFDYVVLDEAQAIKNAATVAAKAARLLRARHRLALSGTPIENHLGELWSLFEFLNPGVLGRSAAFQRITAATSAGDETARVLSRGLRPFILRRTKQQVAQDLPARTEQTIFCELPPKERALYDGLRRHYRTALLGRVARDGIAKSKMHVLEALLRLRQAACHPALIDALRAADSSAKFDVLLPRLREVRAEGHKAIVFSQFTTLLGLLRKALDADGVRYEYLDGKTKDRTARVERFQSDPSLGLFLISLKAGGLGLNLTAADYVFLLDPWWNPAAEAQAIDRAHRIGQIREVFAYRLIAKDTVEEKVLTLQQSKRALADAVLSADAVGLRHLQREDLELLLS